MDKSSCMSNDAFALHELIGYSNPYNSQLHLSAVSDIVNRGNVVNSVTLPSLSDDPGFAERERAATFSSFGSKSLNGRNALNGASNGKFPRVLSIVKQDGSLLNGKKSFGAQIEIPRDDWYEITLNKLSESGSNSSAESFVSKQIQSVETKLTNNGTSSRKRKVSDSSKDEDGNTKRSKQSGNGKNENVGAKTEKGGKEKTAEPQKDYIHVRARRGEATDSHSLAERVRREKISERMKLLQDLVPGCNKATGKALMLEEIINYVQSLQRQVEFMSMKLASLNSELEFNMDNILFKDMLQENGIVPQQMNHLDSSTEAEAELYNNYDDHHQSHQNVQQLFSMDHDAPLFSNLGIQLPYLDVFSAAVPELPAFGDDDLYNITENGFGQKNPVNFPGNGGTCIV